jgi:flagellar FliL protein
VATNPAPAKSAPPPAKSPPPAAAAKGAAPAKGGAAEAPAAAAPRKKPSKLLKPLLAVLLLSGVAAGAWFGGLRHHPAMAFEPKPPAAAEKNAPTFLALDLFTVNLLDTDRERYLQLGVVIELNDPKMLDAVKQKLPIIRSQILMQLANKRMGDLLGMQAKEKLATDIVTRTRLLVASEAADKGVEKAHFSQFIIQ